MYEVHNPIDPFTVPQELVYTNNLDGTGTVVFKYEWRQGTTVLAARLETVAPNTLTAQKTLLESMALDMADGLYSREFAYDAYTGLLDTGGPPPAEG